MKYEPTCITGSSPRQSICTALRKMELSSRRKGMLGVGTLLWQSWAPGSRLDDRQSRNGNFRVTSAQLPGEVEDAGLLEGARRGDTSAFSGLFSRYQGPIFRYAAHMCGRDAADDIVQETFLAILRGQGQYDPARGPVVSYLFGIARHLVLKRMTVREMVGFDGDWDEMVSDAERDQATVLDSMTREETIATVRLAIKSLPPLYREAVVLCELQEMSYEAAAGIAACPVGTIRSRLHRAKALLTAKLSAVRPQVSQRP
ncbi:MAG TPA: RNA polymerase sigma factor [Vicinamibacterales bacterium]